jgi:CYTH domain-containing protein
MITTRRYLIASSLARLIRKERGGNRLTEGHFPNQADRSSFVVIDGDKGSLVLVTSGGGAPVEERTDVPRTHAEALLDVTPGKVDYVRSALSIGAREVRVDRFVTPGPLDLITVDFDKEEDSRDFRPLPWFGPEVTGEAGYQNRAIALEGLPPALDVPLSNAALNTLLDTLEGRLGASRSYAPQKNPRDSEQAEQRRSAAPASEGPAARQTPAPKAEAAPPSESDHSEDDRDGLNLNIEDNVIRELARSLRPQRR